MGGLAGRYPLDDAPGWRRGTRRDSRPAVPRTRRSGCAGARRRRDPGLIPVRPGRARCRAGRARAAWAADAAAPERRPVAAAVRDHRRCGRRAALDRVLADRRRRSRVRHPAQVPNRCRPGVGGSGHGQHGRRRVPGHAGLHEPLRQLAERVGRSEDAGCVADHRRARAAHADRACTAVLQAAKAGAGRGDHRRSGLRDDRPARAAPAAACHPVRLLDRRRCNRRRAVGGSPGRRRGGRRPLARLARLRRHESADAAARPRVRDAGLSRSR